SGRARKRARCLSSPHVTTPSFSIASTIRARSAATASSMARLTHAGKDERSRASASMATAKAVQYSRSCFVRDHSETSRFPASVVGPPFRS
ncbi:MAG: PE domain-containing protein, partial [Betaproteobacteria bacterium]|nr:PE domain-containing protein [Betaproteobacteria bacterium]